MPVRLDHTAVAAQVPALLRRLAGPGAVPHPEQLAAIQAVVADRRRVLVVQRTGWGKSAVYFLATRLLRDTGAGPTFLISPLLALMRDQAAAAERVGVRAASINSANVREWRAIEDQIAANQVDLLLVSPERLNHAVTRKLLRLGHGCLDAVDEVERRLGMPALGPAPVSHDDDVVDPARRLPIPAVRHVEDVAPYDRRPDLVPVRPGVVVGRLRHLQLAALVQRDVTAEQPVEQRSRLVALVRDETVYRHRGVHDYFAHGALLCFGVPPN
jgi:hypothetical protein